MASKDRAFAWIVLAMTLATISWGGPVCADPGVLDLRNWNGKNGVVPLKAEWRVFWHELRTSLPTEDTQNEISRPAEYFGVPGQWQGHRRADGSKVTSQDFATFHLRVLLPPAEEGDCRYTVAIKNAFSAYKLVLHNPDTHTYAEVEGGKVGTDEATTVPLLRSGLASIDAMGSVDIFLQVANFSHYRAGPLEVPVFGREEAIRRHQDFAQAVDFVMIGVIFLVGLYHLLLYRLQPQTKASRDFALFCLLIGVKTLITGQYPADWFPGLSAWGIYLRLEYLGFYLGLPLFASFIYQLFPNDLSPRAIRAIQVTALVLSVPVLVLPANIYGRGLPWFQALVVVSVLYFGTSIFRGCLKKADRMPWVTFTGLLGLMAACANDILYSFQLIDTAYFLHLGFFGFILSQVICFAVYFIRQSDAQARSEAEFKATEHIQRALLPKDSSVPGVQIATYFRAAMHASGDWFGYHHDQERNMLYFYVGDVTGHGVPAAMMTAVVCGALYACEDTVPASDAHVEAIASIINDVVVRTGQGETFIAISFFALDLVTGQVTYVNAGHTSPLWTKARDQSVVAVMNPGVWLGQELDFRPSVKRFKLEPKDQLFIYTDGIVENTGPSGRRLREKELRAFLTRATAPAMAKNLVSDAVHEIWGGAELADDATFLSIQWQSQT